MNINLPTPDELLKFQIENYSEMYKNPRSFEHKIFLRKQIYNLKKLQNGNSETDTSIHRCGNNSMRGRSNTSLHALHERY